MRQKVTSAEDDWRYITHNKYEKYVEMYNKKKEYFEKNGWKMHTKVLEEEEWADNYKNMRDNAIDNGEPIGGINQKLVDRGAYRVSKKQARRIKKFAMKKSGQKLNQEAIEAGEFDWDIIDKYYHELIDSGIDGKKAGKMIGQTFFGSE